MQCTHGLFHVARPKCQLASLRRLDWHPIHRSSTLKNISGQPSRGKTKVSKFRIVPWVFSSLLVGGIAFYSAQLLVAARQPCSNPLIAELSAQKDVSARYESTADSFDGEVGLSEMLMGINRLRKRLAQRTQGHVLEVSAGTGRNLGYYPIGPNGPVDSLTFVDLSPHMVEVCRRKWDVLFSQRSKDQLRPGLVVRFLSASAMDPMPPAPSSGQNGTYDTIVQTMGLCSTPHPVTLLTNIARYLDRANPDARIFLLEHGRSYQPWLNRILDNAAEKHAEIHGCWFNRDIGALVEDAAEQAGLEIVVERRHHFGTTWMFELKPKPEFVESSDSPAVEITSRGWMDWISQK